MDDHIAYDNLCTLAKAIAEHLPGWRAETPALQLDEYPPHIVYIGREDGAGLAINAVRNQHGRIEVSGRYPHEAVPQDRPSITLSTLRPPENLAREITRRFLSAYLAKYEEAQAQLISLREAEARVLYTAEVCANAVGLPLVQIQYNGTHPTGATIYTPVGKLTVEWAGTVRLHSNPLQPTVALEILKRLMEVNAA